MNMRADLYDGAVLIASWTHSGVTGSFQTATQTLTRAQIAAITDLANLRVMFTAIGA